MSSGPPLLLLGPFPPFLPFPFCVPLSLYTINACVMRFIARIADAAAPALPDGGFDEDDGALMHCHVCGVRFFDPIGLRQHVASHSRPKLSNKACEQCGEQFPLQRLLKEHLIKVHRAMPHVCDVCGKGFKIRMDMMR